MQKEEFFKKYVPYIKWGIFGVVSIVLMFIYEKPFSEAETNEIFGSMSNCFAVPGIVLTGFGGLSYLSSLGAYDGLSYIFSNFSLHSIIPGHHKDKPQTLYEYKQQKDEKGRKWHPQPLIVGAVSLGISVVMLIIYAIL